MCCATSMDKYENRINIDSSDLNFRETEQELLDWLFADELHIKVIKELQKKAQHERIL